MLATRRPGATSGGCSMPAPAICTL
jgi:hypothetical protein